MDVQGLEKVIDSNEYTPSALSKTMFYYIQSYGHFFVIISISLVEKTIMRFY
ncbi:MAG: hypothetical protein ACREVX_05845 [Clostridium sp.]|uniref:hypothetical protein n=1 Tax=Clostridium sp. TaxID=1506 RepID=UPI003D6C7186